MNIGKVSVLSSFFLLAWVSGAQGATFYVKTSTASGNGLSWGTAFNNLDAALSAAQDTVGSDQIWIAAGTYKPSIPNAGESNLATFNLPNNVTLYGGFLGNEQKLQGRNPSANPTILSGDLGGNDIYDPANLQTNKSDNAWHVLTANGVSGVVLDGLIVRGGYANGPDAGTTSGAPQFNLISIANAHASGGGLLARNGAKVKLNLMRFEYNASERTLLVTLVTNPRLGNPAAASGGGAVTAIDPGTVVTIAASAFDKNNAFGFGGNGGALNALLEASFDITLTSFTNNSADRIGGAVHGKNAEDINVRLSRFDNNILTGASIGDESGGGIGVLNSNLYVTGSVFTGNVSGPLAGGGGIVFHQPFDDDEPYVFTLNASTFSNNTAGIIGGGAVNILGVASNPGTSASVSNSLFYNNTAPDGGAMYVDAIPTTISNSVFDGNKAGFSGGAIFASDFGDSVLSATLINLSDRPVLRITNSSFTNNSITGLSPFAPTPQFVFNIFAQVLSSIFSTGGASVSSMSPGGGAIASEFAGNVVINNSSFRSNSAPNGGALLIGGAAGTPVCGLLDPPFCSTAGRPAPIGQAYLKISNSICSGNTAAQGNNSFVIDAMSLGATPNGVLYDNSDGSCP